MPKHRALAASSLAYVQVQSAFKNVTLKEVEQLVAEEVAALADMLGLASTNEVERLLRKNNWYGTDDALHMGSAHSRAHR